MQSFDTECLGKFGNYQDKIRAGNIRNPTMRQFALDVLVEFLKAQHPEKFTLYRCAKILGTTTLRTIDIVNEGYNKGVLKTEKTPDEKTLVSFIDKDELNIMTMRWPNIPSRVVD